MKLTIVHEQKCTEKVFRESQCTLSKSQRFIHRLKRGCQTSWAGLKCAWSLKVYERSHPSPVYVYILKACTFSHLMSDPFIKQMMNSLRCRVEKRLSFSFSASAVITWTLTSTYRSHEIYKYTIFYLFFLHAGVL